MCDLEQSVLHTGIKVQFDIIIITYKYVKSVYYNYIKLVT